MRSWLVALIFAVAVAATAIPVRAQAVGEPVFGAATGQTEEPGSLTPTGNGRFTIEGRVYKGTGLGRSVDDELAACFTGRLTSTEDWSLEAPKLDGSHRATVQLRPERGTVTLKLRGRMESMTASGTWEVVRATGPCDGLEAEGEYTATYSDRSPNFRLTFSGHGRR